MRLSLLSLMLVSAVAAGSAHAASRASADLQNDLARLSRSTDGRLGACVANASGPPVCVNGDERFPLQSVMKLFVGVAVMDAVDTKGWRLDEPVVVHRSDLSVCHQPLAEHVTDAGYQTTIDDLVRRAIVDSDCTAADMLIARLGGTSAVQAVLRHHNIEGIRIDRDERHLQTEIDGLSWRPDYTDPHKLAAAIAAVPKQRRSAMYRAYQNDPRDTATPRATAVFLQALAAGRLLSPASTQHLLAVMSETSTFPERLRAGLEPGWSIAHKTGTSGSWDGVTAATNDIGILTAPDGHSIEVVAFLADSRATAKQRNATISAVARAAIADYRPHP